MFKDESGGHQWQRVPPTERSGRVQTSTVTVAVLSEPTEVQVRLDARDLDYRFCRGSGPGGQNRNKTETAVQLTHKPSGLMVRCETERSQDQNKRTALAILRAKLWESEAERVDAEQVGARKQQIGHGMRGGKRRTVRVKDGQVRDVVTGRRWELRAYLRGDW